MLLFGPNIKNILKMGCIYLSYNMFCVVNVIVEVMWNVENKGYSVVSKNSIKQNRVLVLN